MVDVWMPKAVRLPSSHGGGSMAGGPPRCVWHRTVGQGFEGNARYLKAEGFEPQILWDPTTGQVGQFLPANRSAYALQHPAGTIDTNRMGTLCVQVEVADHGQTWPITSTAMLGWPALRAWLRALGIPEVWPGGPPPPLGSRAEVTDKLWASAGGHYSHSQVPNNSHTDPGRMDLSLLFPSFVPPGDRWLGLSNPPMTGHDVAGVRHALRVAGNAGLAEGTVYDRVTADLVALFQQRHRIDERGVGPQTWAALRAVVHH